MTRLAPAVPHGGDWLSLGPASRLLGVDPDTLRRWSDTGRVRAFATPGGHRRFSRADLDRVRAGRRPGRRRLATLGATPDRMTRAYARSYRTDAAPLDADRFEGAARDAFRSEGRRLVAVLLADLDATTAADRARWEGEAMALITSIGERLAEIGADAAEAVGIYIHARRPFLTELAAIGRRRAMDPTQLASLFEQAVGLLDRLLLQLVVTHARASASGGTTAASGGTIA
jgi:excisionase family DNA binding protein